jgi:phospholipid/cholesterol/gamma-HCH transport system substrate-binding protein
LSFFAGSAATYRGVKAGRVTDMQLTASGVVATVSLSSGTKVPAASLARVRSLSPVGEQFIDFVPEQAGGPYLQDGSVVEATATDLPQSLASTVVAVNGVLREIDDRKLRLLLRELSTGGIDTLGSLLAGGTLKLDLIFDREELCQYGTARRDPRDPDRRDLQTGGSCSGSQVPRGAAHAPGPVAAH